ncbi:MAG: hypothetical protein ACI4WM_00310 [Erysipelotrichaceae bacterium]
MNNIFKTADRYVKESDWKDLAMLKICLCGMGMVIGSALAPRYKREVMVAGSTMFALTYVPLMTKFIGICIDERSKNN